VWVRWVCIALLRALQHYDADDAKVAGRAPC
jgi:hypothetical protein